MEWAQQETELVEEAQIYISNQVTLSAISQLSVWLGAPMSLCGVSRRAVNKKAKASSVFRRIWNVLGAKQSAFGIRQEFYIKVSTSSRRKAVENWRVSLPSRLHSSSDSSSPSLLISADWYFVLVSTIIPMTEVCWFYASWTGECVTVAVIQSNLFILWIRCCAWDVAHGNSSSRQSLSWGFVFSYDRYLVSCTVELSLIFLWNFWS